MDQVLGGFQGQRLRYSARSKSLLVCLPMSGGFCPGLQEATTLDFQLIWPASDTLVSKIAVAGAPLYTTFLCLVGCCQHHPVDCHL